jgi:hypothetical protein
MTAGLYMPVDWPKRVEEIAAQRGRPIDVLNFATDGGGVMNWWCIIKHIIAKENYDLDDCLFAVCCDDLSRGLFIRHDEIDGTIHKPWFGRVKGISQSALPLTLKEAQKHAFPIGDDPGYPSSTIDALMSGQDVPGLQSSNSRLLKVALLALVIHRFQPQGLTPDQSAPSEEMLARFKEMYDELTRLSVRLWVVQVPMGSVDSTNEFRFTKGVAKSTMQFSEMMMTTPIDGSDAFDGLTDDEIKQHFLDGDPHWNQRGANRFADFIERTMAQPQASP